MLRRRAGSAVRLMMAATSQRMMLLFWLKVPFSSLPVSTPARYSR